MITVWDWAIQLQMLGIVLGGILKPIVSLIVILVVVLVEKKKSNQKHEI